MAFNLFGKKEKKEEKAKTPSVAPVQPPAGGEAPAEASAPTAPVVTGPSVLRRMHVSEKSSRGQAMGQYTFIVDSSACKPEIAKAVETRYSVKVDSVKIVNLPSKTRRIGKYFGSKAGVTKAIVVLAKGQSIATA
jgi:large subunit ribosomal protein L23